ncbi:glycosyltransferase [Vibrio splendidus]|uniref:hypothetical protein n=1 Tax=Vibrio splendidus TaxID=29497 RepID=UPI0024696E6F|nr:hypothetical protein [Vibrio splendidus]MDH5905136.1 glycosyltransferase [Vibrio splendidus]
MNDIPIAVFIFKRSETLARIFEKIREYGPKTIYLIADGPRNEEEKKLVEKTRAIAEKLIDWDCKVVKNYSDFNRGVYQNIGGGAKWVFEREEMAIFLEDDNLPESSFFNYCEELLKRFEHDNQIFWVCGTNYIENFIAEQDYVFTKHMLPCGWASWSKKFERFYDGDLINYSPDMLNKLKETYDSKALFEQDIDNFNKTKRFLDVNKERSSWDRQVAFSLRYYDLLGIAPTKNQIRNIGVDELSTHGGTSLKKTMTSRFCELETSEISFPMKHPTSVSINYEFEKETTKIILNPLKDRVIMKVMKLIKPFVGIRQDESLVLFIRDKMNVISKKK